MQRSGLAPQLADQGNAVSSEQRPVLLGELLTRAGILTPEMLEEALQRSKETRLPLGKIVTWSGYISDEQLHAAVEAQSLINDRLLSLDIGIKAVKMVLNKTLDLDSALDELGWSLGEVYQRNRLGDLLLAAGMLSEERLNEALRDGASTHLPLGQVLACMPEPINAYVRASLSAQSLVREGKISREQAIEALQLVKDHCVSFEQALFELGIREASIISSVELSELLFASGAISQSQMMRAVERSLELEQPLSQCLIDAQFVTAETLQAARDLRIAVNNGTTTRAIAVDALRQVHNDAINPTKALQEAEERAATALPKITALDLLRLAALVTEEDIRKVTGNQQSAAQESVRLPKNDSIDEKTFYILIECLELLDRGTINVQQAIVVLNICLRRKVPLSEALSNLGVHR